LRLSAEGDTPFSREIARANAITDIKLLDMDPDDRGHQIGDSLERRV
jgi:hypothetical protein